MRYINRLILVLLCLVMAEFQTGFLACIAAEQIQHGHINNDNLLQNDQCEEESHFITGVTIYGYHFGCDKINRLAREGVEIGTDSGNNYLNLQKGNILLNPEKDLIVETHAGRIHVNSGATIFIMESDDTVIVCDLLQTKPKQVSLAVPTVLNKPAIVLEPGSMLVLTRQNTQDFEQLEMNSHIVTYQNAKFLNCYDNTINAFVANFSIPSALATIEPLKRLTISDNKQDKLVLAKLLKGAVVLGASACPVEPSKTIIAQLRNPKADAVNNN